MKDLPRLSDVGSGKAAAPPSIVAFRKVAIYLMAALVMAVMLAWLSFLGWAAFAMLSMLIDLVRAS